MSETIEELLETSEEMGEGLTSAGAGRTGETAETAERFDPAEMRGAVVEAEHLARYRFAAALAGDKVVLDAACGWGYGSNMLAAAGASRVIGVDIADAVVEAARAEAADNVSFETGDIEQLDFSNASFDCVVCFEAIEHVERWGQTLDEFARVLSGDGILVISTPNDSAYGDRNEHHIHQFEREEFRDELESRFRYVEVYAQSAWIASAISTHEWFDSAGIESPIPSVLKPVAGRDHGEIYDVAVASNTPLPNVDSVAALASPVEFKEWIERMGGAGRIPQRSSVLALGSSSRSNRQVGRRSDRAQRAAGRLRSPPYGSAP
ncbi:MAG: class I SAM-dependent methyltransferase [Solirubrobacterales bacterium]